MAEIIIDKISNKHYLNHIIICDPSTTTSYASSILLREHYRDLDISTSEYKDWRYYFIIRRHYLRRQKKDGKWVCHYCGRDIFLMPERNKKRQDTRNCITVDHIVPASECEDKLDTSNFVECCYKCNQEKGTKTYTEFKLLKDC